MTETRILIVDDQPEILFALKMIIKGMGAQYVVATAVDGFEALDILQEEIFDLVITDYMMPGMDGLELVESIRALSPDTRLVVISGLQEKMLKTSLDEARISYFLSKPFSKQAVQDIILKALSETSGTRPLSLSPVKAPVDSKVTGYLNELRYHTGAHSCLIVESLGYIIAVDGGDENMPLDSLASLIAANAQAVVEVSRLMGNPEAFQTTIYKGKHFNMASYILDEGQILVVIFGEQVKMGLVQHYARRIIPNLSAALPAPPDSLEDEFFGGNFAASGDDSMESLFTFDNSGNNGR